MSDIVFLVVILGFFLLAAMAVRACEQIIGRDAEVATARGDVDADEPACEERVA